MLRRYIIKRILIAIPTLLAISLLVFLIIDLPPGSYLDTEMEKMEQDGQVDMAKIRMLEEEYHMNDPVLTRYFYWITGFVQGEFGKSFSTNKPVRTILADLLPATMCIAIFTLLLTWSIAIPFGITAAVKKNTVWDYMLTFIGLLAMSTPGFIIAVIFQVIMTSCWPNFDPTGLFSSEYRSAAWSWAKFVDMLKHIWIPMFILGVAGTAGMIRILRANVIDELKKQYVLCARARGLHPLLVVIRYPVRVAINPFVSGIGLVLPRLISGSVIVAVVLGLPTLGPRLLAALREQDTYVACSIIFIQCILAIVGLLISDILLSVVDPRIRFEGK